MRAGLLAVILATALAASGCGSSSTSGQIIEDGPTTVGTVSAELTKTAILSDVATVRGVVDVSGTTKAINAVYAVINQAGKDKDVNRGAATLRDKIPPLVAQFKADYQPTLGRLRGLQFKTRAGDRFRRFDIALLIEWNRVLPQLRSDLATSDKAWGAIVTFGARNNQMLKRLNRKLSALVDSLPSAQRRVLEQAVQQTFGK